MDELIRISPGNLKTLSVIIREAGDGDYEGIVECLATVRGPHYYEKKVYDTAYLKESGDYTFFVAVAADGEIAGTVALSRGLFGANLCVPCMLAIKNRFTGIGLATALFERDIEYLVGMNPPSIKTHVVTGQNRVQSMVEKHGFYPTGLLFGVRDNAKGLTEEMLRSDKRSLAIYAKGGRKKDAGRLYVHESLHGIVKDTYDSLGASVRISSGGQSLDDGSLIHHFYDEHHSVTYVQVVRCGSDLRDRILSFQKRVVRTQTETITLLLNIASPSAVYGYEVLREMGFIFSGFDPLGDVCEHIVMFYKGIANLLMDEIKTSAKLGALLNEVLRHE